MEIDEQIVYTQLSTKKNAVWSLLLASGYLKVADTVFTERIGRRQYKLALTNKEVRIMFEDMVRDWFSWNDNYNDFVKALLLGDLKAMNRVTLEMFSYFDTGKSPQGEPERFYHGFVPRLMAELADRYVVTSNRESGFGRYDIMLEPQAIPETSPWAQESIPSPDGIIIEFKVQEEDETELADTAARALQQIEEKNYQASLMAKGIPESRIRKYGFAFCGKKVLIATAKSL